MKFLFDHNLPPKLARALHHLAEPDHAVVALSDKFDCTIRDVDLLQELGNEGGWALVTGDAAILKKAPELEALRASRCHAFILARGWADVKFWEKAAKLVKCWPTVINFATGAAEPSVFELRTNGKLTPCGTLGHRPSVHGG